MPPVGTGETRPALRPVRPSVKAWPAQTTTYVVGKGECLSVIAKRYNLSVAEIGTLNGIADPDRICSGQKLILPGRIDVGVPRPQEKTKTAKPVLVEGNAYVVKPGDCLSVIAAACGTTVEALREANLLSSDRIMAGQKLVVPEGGVEKARSGAGAPEMQPDTEPVGDLARPAESALAEKKELEEPIQGIVPVSSMRMHVVQESEDLYSVAMMWGVSVAGIREANDLADEPLKPGQRLKIPMSE